MEISVERGRGEGHRTLPVTCGVRESPAPASLATYSDPLHLASHERHRDVRRTMQSPLEVHA
jgi:hypothetical protein